MSTLIHTLGGIHEPRENRHMRGRRIILDILRGGASPPSEFETRRFAN